MTDKQSSTVVVSRELLERITSADFSYGAYGTSSSGYTPLEELRALLAARPEQQGEPVAKVVSKFGDPEAFGEREVIVLADLSKIPYDTPLYRHPWPPAKALPVYRCHLCGDETGPPAPYKLYVSCDCGATTAASAALMPNKS